MTRALLLAAVLAVAVTDAHHALAQQHVEDDEAALLVSEGRAALAHKKYDRAAASLDRALAVNPRRLDAYILRAGVHAALKQYDQGIALLRRALVLQPDNGDVMAALGSQLLLSGEHDEGVRLLQTVVTRAPGTYQAQAALGRQYAADGKWKEAAVALRAYLGSRPGALAGEDAIWKTDLAEAQLRSGEPAAALALFDEVAESDPRNTRAKVGGAWAAAAIDCQTAMPRLAELEPLADRVPEIWLVSGKCRLGLGQIVEARDLADRFLAKNPQSGPGHALRGEAILAGGNPYEARRELDKALALAPSNERLLLRWARAAREGGSPADAVAKLKAAGTPEVTNEPDWTTELSQGYIAIGQPGEALVQMKPVVDKYPDDKGARLAYGEALLATGAPGDALPHLELAAAAGGPPRARGPYADALTAVGTAELSADQTAEAERHLARAVEVGGGDAALVNLGIARLVLGDTKGALPPLEKAARAPKNNGAALLVYGRALAAAGRANEATLTLESALPGADPARAADLALELAAVDVEGSDPGRAVARIEGAMGRAPAAQRARLESAIVPAARAAASRAMSQGNFSTALRLLERAEKLAGKGDMAVAVRCDLALAATAAGDRDGARARLRQLEGVRCPFVAPADELAVPILTAVNTRPDDARVDAALAKLAQLGGRARGPAARLCADATRWLAARAAQAALSRNRLDKARRYLILAAKAPGASPEIAYDAAVLELEAGRVEEAQRALEAIADQVPEAWAALGIAEERGGDPRRALELYRKAAERGARFAELDDWIAGKVRLLGEAP